MMITTRRNLLPLILFLSLTPCVLGFVGRRTSTTVRHPSLFAVSSSAEEEAKALLERARKMRQEIASLEGRTVEEVEQEAAQKKQQQEAIIAKAAAERQAQRKSNNSNNNINLDNGRFLIVPETPEDQVVQAKQAIERAFDAGINRQIVRFALIPEGEYLNQERQWPGGAQQMYRRAAGPMTRDLLQQVRATTTIPKDKTNVDSAATAAATAAADWSKPPTVQSQDIWDFDGSALITAQAAAGPAGDVQAMVLSNTDNKYTEDIDTISKAMKDRLFLLVNPFWRDIDSWGMNILAPNAKKRAQQVIFDGGFQETYCLIQKSVRGEDCIALKAYPYDWQLYAYAETDYWPYEPYIMHLGSTKEEPKGADFVKFLDEHEEFKMSKNMRQMQRMMKKDE